VVRGHVHRDTSRAGDLLQVALSTGCPTEVVQSSNNLEHGSECKLADAVSEALVRPKAEVHVRVHVAVQPDLVRLREGGRIRGGGDLKILCEWYVLVCLQ